MQFHMQSNKSVKMQSCMQSDNEGEMQNDIANEMQCQIQLERSNKLCRAYQARPKRKGTIHHNSNNLQKISEKEAEDDRCLRAPTPSDIDLPPSSILSDANSISQNLLFDKVVTYPLKNEVLLSSSAFNCVSEYSQTAFISGNSTLDHMFRSDTIQIDLKSSQLLVDTLATVENTADFESSPPDAEILQESNRPSVPNKNEKKVRGSTLNKSRRSALRTKEDKKIQTPRTRLKRPQHQVLGFMEDHAEFGSDLGEASECQGRYASSILESTVDGSIIKGARRLYGSRMSSGQLSTCINSAIQVGDVHEDPLKALDDWGLKTELHKYKCSKCDEVSQHRSSIEHHITESEGTHSEAVVVVLLGSKAQGRNCSLCNIRLHRTEYFKHIREVHKTKFPLRCGYCVFQGQDHNQLRHHIQKKHGTSNYNIIDVSHSLGKDIPGSKPSSSDIEAVNDEQDVQEDLSKTQTMMCPLCNKSLKTLHNLKKHVMQHSRQKKQCSLCSFTTNFPTQIRSHYKRKHPTETPKWQKIVVDRGGSDALVDDATPYLQMVAAKYGIRKPKGKKWMRQYRCPYCDYTCSFNSSFNRHLRVHEGFKPFKCGYCNFHGREAYITRKHCSKVHKGKEVKLEIDRDFKGPYRYAKKMKKEIFDWDESVDAGGNEVEQQYMPIEDKFMKSRMSNKNNLKEKKKEMAVVKCFVIAKEKVKNNDDDDNKETVVHPPENYEKENLEIPPLTISNNLKKIGRGPIVNPEVCETLVPHVRWEEDNETDKQNVNIILEGNFSKTQEKCIFNSDSQEVFTNEKTGEALPGVSLMENHLIEESNLSPEKLKILMSASSASHGISQTVKVKTFRCNIERSHKYCKENGSSFDESNNNDMQSSVVSSESIFNNDNISSCVVINPTSNNLSDSKDRHIVIQLYANDNETCPLREVITLNSKEELEDGYEFDQNSCETSKVDVSMPLEVLPSDTADVHSSDVADNISIPQSMLKEHSVIDLECSQLVKSVKVADVEDEKGTLHVEHSSKVPPHGLENNLHSHITFLADSLAHRLNNRISAPPGVMTRDLLGLDYSNSDYFSSEKVRMMMKKKKGGRVKCRECGVTTTCRAFYKHAKKHFNIKPFKCGYCTYRSIEKSKIRVHNAFCHPRKPCIILKLPPETAGIDGNASRLAVNENVPSTSKHIIVTTNCTNKVNEICAPNILENTKESLGKISSKSIKSTNGETKTSSTTTDKTAIGLASKLSPFQCPICSKVLKNHSPSIRRHLYSHYGYKPYRCGYCTFTAIGQTEIRAHHVKHGSINSPKIESSGVSMPFDLTQYIEELLNQQRGSKRCHKKREQYNPTQCNLPKNPDADIMWHEPDTSSKEDLTTMYLNSEDQSHQGLVPDDQHELEALDVESCSLQQSLGAVEFNSESTYAVQVLEAGRQNSSIFFFLNKLALPDH